MATPCDSELAQAPFETYRDPKTGEWRLEKFQNSVENVGKVIPFRRITKSFMKANQIVEAKDEIM